LCFILVVASCECQATYVFDEMFVRKFIAFRKKINFILNFSEILKRALKGDFLLTFYFLLNDEFWVQPIICNLQSDVIFYYL
jgi:hypothetical protein